MKNFYKDITKGKSYFYYYGWTIIAFLLGFYLIAFIIFQAMFFVPRTNRIEIFIAAQGINDAEYNVKLQKEFEEQGLMQVDIYSYYIDDANVYNYFSANGEKADFIIFPESVLNDMQDYVKDSYFELSTLVDGCSSINDYESFKYEEKPYGIKIFDGVNEAYNTQHHFTDLIEFTKEGKTNESYYLLVDNESPNFNKENGNTLGYSVLEYLLSSMLG